MSENGSESEFMPRESFDSFYERELLPDLKELEQERKNIRSTLLYPTIGLGGLALGLIAVMPNLGIQAMILAAISGVVLFTWFKTKASMEFRMDFKNKIIRKSVRHCNEKYQYSGFRSINRADFDSSGIMTRLPDRYHGDDLITGQSEQSSFSFSEVHSQIYVKDSKGRRKLQTQFKGLFFMADFNKKLSHHTVIVADIAERFLGNMGQQLQKLNFNRGDLVQMENVDFEKIYAVYGEDQVEARYILTPKLMERLVAFSEKHEVTPSLAFKGSNVYVAIPISKDFFEPRIFQTILDKELCQEYVNDMNLALCLIEELDLDNRIWSKIPVEKK
jgi:hypothetical protein